MCSTVGFLRPGRVILRRLRASRGRQLKLAPIPVGPPGWGSQWCTQGSDFPTIDSLRSGVIYIYIERERFPKQCLHLGFFTCASQDLVCMAGLPIAGGTRWWDHRYYMIEIHGSCVSKRGHRLSKGVSRTHTSRSCCVGAYHVFHRACVDRSWDTLLCPCVLGMVTSSADCFVTAHATMSATSVAIVTTVTTTTRCTHLSRHNCFMC